MKHVLVTLPLSEEEKEYFVKQTEGASEEYSYTFTGSNNAPLEDVIKADIIIGNPSADKVKQNDHLQWIQLHSAGFENYTESGSLAEGCILTNARGAYGLTISEHMLAMTFALMRRFPQYVQNQEKHAWQHMGKVKTIEGSTCVVLGMGDIGSDYARKMKALGAYVIGIRKHMNEKPDCFDEQYLVEDIDQVLPRADFFGMVIPGGKENYHILDERRMRLMKDDAIVINLGRGSAIDPDALKKLVKEGKFFGVGLDVTEPEPLTSEDELWEMERVMITPHAAGGFCLDETLKRIIRISGENLKAFANGTEMRNVIKY